MRRLWWAALETLQQEMIETEVNQGIWVAAPLPALYEPQLLRHLEGWVWAPEQLDKHGEYDTACDLWTLGVLLFASSAIEKRLGQRGLNVLSKITGLVLTALSAQIVSQGVKGLFLKS